MPDIHVSGADRRGTNLCLGKKKEKLLSGTVPPQLQQGPSRLSVAGVGAAQPLFGLFLSFGDAAVSSAGERHRSCKVALLYCREKPTSWHHPQCSGAFLGT